MIATTISFPDYLKRIPLLHTWDNGASWNTGGFGADHLRAFHDCLLELGPGATVMETGAGNSTLTFLLAGAGRVISIGNDHGVYDRIRGYCREHGIDDARLETHVGRSEVLLPALALEMVAHDGWIDFAMLDGGHGWPTCFVDFCYMNSVLRRGGAIVVDDIQLHSVKELARFMVHDRRFRLRTNLGKTLVFSKTTDERFLPDFSGQPYVMLKSKSYEASGHPFALD
ncbi:MAG: class I SAM-dependent methyltransferase [Acidobacteria bacterium]|nr:class I SAM-dependent methyltransferase [Acidobacteriota bacterium]